MIRAAVIEDVPAIVGLWNPVIRDTLSTFNSVEKTADDVVALIAQKTAAGQAFLVAQVPGGIAGFVTYGQFRAGIGYAHTMEHTIIIGGDTQRRGLGRALLTAMEDHARAAGAHSMFGGISAPNLRGRAFHAALGYREMAVLPEVGFKFGRWLDLVLMQKLLA